MTAARPPGDDKTLWRATLETGSRLLQTSAPLEAFDICVAGVHCARHAPHMQIRRVQDAERRRKAPRFRVSLWTTGQERGEVRMPGGLLPSQFHSLDRVRR